MFKATAAFLITGVLLVPATPQVEVSSTHLARVSQEGGDDFPKPENVTVSEWCSEAGSKGAVDRCFAAWAYADEANGSGACMEDEPCWDCRSMGNRVCGLPVGSNGERVLVYWPTLDNPVVVESIDELPATE